MCDMTQSHVWLDSLYMTVWHDSFKCEWFQGEMTNDMGDTRLDLLYMTIWHDAFIRDSFVPDSLICEWFQRDMTQWHGWLEARLVVCDYMTWRIHAWLVRTRLIHMRMIPLSHDSVICVTRGSTRYIWLYDVTHSYVTRSYVFHSYVNEFKVTWLSDMGDSRLRLVVYDYMTWRIHTWLVRTWLIHMRMIPM